ncbi:hypothetical protein ACWEK7_24395, partial [Streptomyces californicus]
MTVAAVAAPERPAHRDPNVLRWLGAYTASMIGDSVYFMALAWAAARTGSASGAGLVLAAGSLPRALLILGGCGCGFIDVTTKIGGNSSACSGGAHARSAG